jgi:diphthamide biosynthesis enzyme Dph1/Dph2-like protein
MKLFDLNLKKVVGIIRDKRYKFVGVQLPEGLKVKATKISLDLEKETGCEVFLTKRRRCWAWMRYSTSVTAK